MLSILCTGSHLVFTITHGLQLFDVGIMNSIVKKQNWSVESWGTCLVSYRKYRREGLSDCEAHALRTVLYRRPKMWYKGNTGEEVISISGVLIHFCLGFHLWSALAPPTFSGILSCHGSWHHSINLWGPWSPTVFITYSLGEKKFWLSNPTYGYLFKRYIHIPLDLHIF